MCRATIGSNARGSTLKLTIVFARFLTVAVRCGRSARATKWRPVLNRARKQAGVAFMLLSAPLAVHLSAQWVNYPTASVPRLPNGQPNLAAPAPRTADGKPDLTGVWMAEDQKYFQNLAAGLKPEDVILQPWARALQQQRTDNQHSDDPLARCLPHGVPRINTNGLFPFKIVQTPAVVVILYEQLNLFRQVFMDGRKLANEVNPTWLGYSTGKWDDDTLVIETSGFNGKT